MVTATTATATTELVTISTNNNNNSNDNNHHQQTEDVEIGLPPTKPQQSSDTAIIPSNDSNGGKGFLKPLPETTLLERIAGIVAIIAIGSAVAAAIIEQSIIVIIGAILSSIIGPYCYYQQTKLTDIRTLQETKTAITEQVNQLKIENQRLVQNITNLTTSVDRLEDIEQALSVLTTTQGQSIEAFQKQVTDNQVILQQMKKNVQANVLQNLLSVVLRSDTNQDMIMNEVEISTLIRRLQNISGVQVNEIKFREAIQNQSITSIMNIIKNLLRPDIPENERIFTFTKSPTSSPTAATAVTASGSNTATSNQPPK
jgi:glutaredoxin 2